MADSLRAGASYFFHTTLSSERAKMPVLYYVNVTVHVLAAFLWLGGMFFLAVVGAPALRAVEPPQLRQQLFNALGTRFRYAGWVAITVLLVTGVVNLRYRGWLSWSVLGSSGFWRTGTGKALAVKLIAVGLMVGLSLVHDFILGPRAGRARPGSPEANKLRRRSAWNARIEALIGLILLMAAVRLVR
jgi:copper resistance protein D